MSRPRPVCLIVIDGWGLNDCDQGNALKTARTPVLSGLLEEYPHCRLAADGEAVGLMHGQMGDSNVGHLNLGAGRVVYQDLVRISKAVRSGAIFENPALLQAMRRARSGGGRLHLMGLVSDGGVHSHLDHLLALLDMAKREGAGDVAVHCFMDGRDTPPTSGKGYIERLETHIRETGTGRIATVMGRYYAMDRDKRWDRIKSAFDAIVWGRGRKAGSASEVMEGSYAEGVTDEFVVPVVTGPTGMGPGDAVIFFNFRADRARQLTHALVDREFDAFDRGDYRPVPVVCMAQYEEGIDAPVAFPPQYIKNTFGEVVSRHGLRQLRIAETEKYAHVTFFFNGMEERPFDGEERILIPSPKVATYDLKPEMSAPEVAESVLEEIRGGKYDVIVLNFANLDMVGHTGSLSAAVEAVETVDRCTGSVIRGILAAGGAALVCADHGNAECMTDESGGPHTAHTSNPVPCILVDPSRRDVSLRDGALADVAPTLLEILGIEKPAEMDGESLMLGGRP
ncbi:MAG: 2,3-bisphosphoglycerate-independent phosphoglycerate mutase [Bacillota bacterium]